MIDSKRFSIVACAVGALLLVALLGWYFVYAMQAPAQAVVQKKPLFPNDAEMQAAYSKAQDGLDYFLELAAKPPAETQGFAIKARILEGEREEFFWLYPFEASPEGLAGRVNDDPKELLKLFKGDIVVFVREDVIDWTFGGTRLDNMHANFTGCVELQRQAPENARQFQQLFGLDCDR